jgi:hypothetical protein
MVEPLTVVGIDGRGVVVSTQTLPVGGVAHLAGAHFTLELAATAVLPDPGSKLDVHLWPGGPRFPRTAPDRP